VRLAKLDQFSGRRAGPMSSLDLEQQILADQR
jgi:hypothetical protein